MDNNSMLNSLPFDPMILIIGFSVLSLVLLVVVIICIMKMNKLYHRYDIFMRGKDAETLEDIIHELMDEVDELHSKDRASKDMMKLLSKQVKTSFQKYGFVKYNAFKGMGGNLSFVLAMLDDNNTGFILDAVHSREGCYLYLKEVEEGATEVLLGSEEQEALEQALGYVKRPTLSERLAKQPSGEEKERNNRFGSGSQAIEIPNRERRKSERMKELRRRQSEEQAEPWQEQQEEQRQSRSYQEPGDELRFQEYAEMEGEDGERTPVLYDDDSIEGEY